MPHDLQPDWPGNEPTPAAERLLNEASDRSNIADPSSDAPEAGDASDDPCAPSALVPSSKSASASVSTSAPMLGVASAPSWEGLFRRGVVERRAQLVRSAKAPRADEGEPDGAAHPAASRRRMGPMAMFGALAVQSRAEFLNAEERAALVAAGVDPEACDLEGRSRPSVAVHGRELLAMARLASLLGTEEAVAALAWPGAATVLNAEC